VRTTARRRALPTSRLTAPSALGAVALIAGLALAQAAQTGAIQAGTGFSITSNPLISAGGFTTVDLRGLGAVRTLTLMDGRRLAPGDPQVPVADLDTIVQLLADRVGIVAGGASAVHGTDALASAVNFDTPSPIPNASVIATGLPNTSTTYGVLSRTIFIGVRGML
jgi:outer membrane cobalamin receptor